MNIRTDQKIPVESGPSNDSDFVTELRFPVDKDIQDKMIEFKTHFLRKAYPEAEQILNQIIDVKTSDASLYYLRAEVLMRQNKFIQSLKDMNEAIRLEPVKQCAKSSEQHYEIKKTLMQMSNDI